MSITYISSRRTVETVPAPIRQVEGRSIRHGPGGPAVVSVIESDRPAPLGRLAPRQCVDRSAPVWCGSVPTGPGDDTGRLIGPMAVQGATGDRCGVSPAISYTHSPSHRASGPLTGSRPPHTGVIVGLAGKIALWLDPTTGPTFGCTHDTPVRAIPRMVGVVRVREMAQFVPGDEFGSSGPRLWV